MRIQLSKNGKYWQFVVYNKKRQKEKIYFSESFERLRKFINREISFKFILVDQMISKDSPEYKKWHAEYKTKQKIDARYKKDVQEWEAKYGKQKRRPQT